MIESIAVLTLISALLVSEEEGREIFYRGTRREQSAGRQKLESWTPCLACAIIWSSSPIEKALVPTSTVHAARLPLGTHVFDATRWGSAWNLRDVFDAIGDPANFELDVKKFLYGLHKRRLGRTRLPSEFKAIVFDEDDESILDDDEFVDFSFMDPDTTPRAFYREFFEFDPTLETASRFVADSFVFADSPTIQRLLKAKGYGAVRYIDPFDGASLVSKKLLGMDADEIPGVEEVLDLDLEYTLTHETLRPFVEMEILWSQPSKALVK